MLSMLQLGLNIIKAVVRLVEMIGFEQSVGVDVRLVTFDMIHALGKS